MLRRVELELANTQATPFTLLFAIYNAKLALKVPGWESLDLAKQCEYLNPEGINTKSARKKIVNDLIEKEQNFQELREKSYIRIRVKHVLSMYYKETAKLLSSTSISEWKQHDIILSFIHHLVRNANSDEKTKTSHPKVWQFADYLRRYFNAESYDGKEFLSTFDKSKNKGQSNKPIKGFGLQMMKTVCTKYGLKSGPFSKVKKQCNIWATNIHNQSQGQLLNGNKVKQDEPKYNKYQSIVAESVQSSQNSNNENQYNIPKKPHNYSKFVTDVSMYVNKSQPTQQNDVLNGKSWYWFSDSNGFKWIPYKENDVQKLNMGWRNKEKFVLIMDGNYRVEFDRSNDQSPAGNQYNNRIQNPGGRTVICSPSKTDIHGIPVQKQAM